MRVKGYTLIYIVIIMLILTILCSLLFQFISLEKRVTNNYEVQTQLCLDVESSINIWASNIDNIIKNDENVFCFNHNYYIDTTIVKTYQWGIYYVISASSKYEKNSCNKQLMVGIEPTMKNASIVLLSRNNIINVSETSLINGDILGDVKKIKVFSEPNSDKPKYTSNFTGGIIPLDPSVIKLPNFSNYITNIYNNSSWLSEIPDTIENSFGDSTLIYYLEKPYLQDKTIIGNVIIVSEKEVFISKNNTLKDIIVIAPEITIERGFKGSVQIIASDLINIEEECTLLYPSSIILNSDTNSRLSKIMIGENTKITGVIYANKESRRDKTDCIIQLAEGVDICGQVVTNGIIDIRGNIIGQIICKKILASNASGIYENHLFGAKIDMKNLPSSFAGANISSINKRTKKIKWLW